MDESGIDEVGLAATLRQLRGLTETGPSDSPSGWREDLRLFAFTWAAGFLFFLLVIA